MANVESPASETSKQSNTLDISIGASEDESVDGRGYEDYQHMKMPLPDLKNTTSMQVMISDNESRGYESDSQKGQILNINSQIDSKSDVTGSDIGSPYLGGNKADGYPLQTSMVVMLGIGYYDGDNNNYGHLDSVPTDYRNMIKLFVDEMNFSFLYQTDDNNLEFLTKSELIKLDGKYQTNFKLKWDNNEITNFIQTTKSLVKEKKADSLIFLISSHSDDTNKSIIDSECKKYSLKDIYVEFDNNKDGCKYLAHKPKIIIVDTPYSAPNANDEAKDELKENNNDFAGYHDFCFVFNNLGAKGGKDGGYLCNGLQTSLSRKEQKLMNNNNNNNNNGQNARELEKIIESLDSEMITLAKNSGDDKLAAVKQAIKFTNNIIFDVNFP